MTPNLKNGLIIAGLLALHLGLVIRQYPPGCLADGGLPVKGDVARYLATAEGVYRIGGSGYDPRAMAGYPVGLWNSMGKKGYEVLGHLLPGVPLGTRFYALLVILSVVSPLIYFLVAWRLLPTVPAALVLAFVFAVWHLDSQVGFFWTFGNVLYPGTCALLPLQFVLASDVCTRHRPLAAAAVLGILTAWIFYAHTAVLFAFIVPAAGLAVWTVCSRRSPVPLLWLGFAALIATVLVAPWLNDLLKTRADCVPQPHEWFQAGPKALVFDLFSDRAYGHPFDRNLFLHIVTVAGIVGCFLARRISDQRVVFIGLAGVWCLLIAFTFTYVPVLRSIQPYRFLIPAILCLSVPAMGGLWEGVRVYRSSPPASRRLILFGALAFMPAATAYGLDIAQPPLHCGLPPDDRNLLDEIRSLPGQGRIICEPDQVAHLVPYWSGKAVLGGLNDQAFLKHRFAGMLDGGVLFGRRAAEWEETNLRTYLVAYAAEYAVFSSDEWLAYADSHPTLFEPVSVIGEFGVYQIIDANPDMVLNGKGRVAVLAETISVTGASGNLVVKLHYSGLLKLPAGVIAAPVAVLDDPVPFLELRVPEGLDSFEIRYR